MGGHSSRFYLLAIVNSAAMNMCEKYLLEYLFSVVLGYMLRSGIAESYDNSAFNFLRNS